MDRTVTSLSKEDVEDVENDNEPSLQVPLLTLVVLQVAVLEPGQVKEANVPYGEI